MAAPHTIDPTALLEQHLAEASPDVLRQMITSLANAMMSAQADQVCGADYGQRSAERVNQRNGYRAREWDTRAGTVELAVPKLRAGSFYPDWLLTHRRRAEQALVTVVATAYLLGVSTRRVERLAEQLGVNSLSRSQVSEMAAHLDAQVAAFRERPLDAGPYTFVWVDALTVKVREAGRGVNVHALVATGVNADGHREILGLDVASAEDGAGWLAFLRGLVARGLSGVQLVISDAHPGLVAAIGSALIGSSWQRCRVHWSCKGSTWWCRGVLVGGERGEDVGCGGEPGGGGGGCEAVLGQDRADFTDEVADGAPADLEQFGEGVLGAQLALVEHGREHSLVVGDLLLEHTAAGAGQAFPATAAVAVALVARGLDGPDAGGHRGELDAGQTGEGGIGKPVGHPRALRLGLAAGDELGQRAGGGEPQRGRWDRVMVVVEQLASLRDRLADGARVDPQQVRQHVLRADLAQVDDGDQHAVGARQQPRAARAGCPAALSTALFKPALGGLGFLGGGQRLGERGQLVAAHAGQPLIGQQVQRRVPRVGAFLGADRRDLPAGGGDGVVPLPVLGVRFDR